MALWSLDSRSAGPGIDIVLQDYNRREFTPLILEQKAKQKSFTLAFLLLSMFRPDSITLNSAAASENYIQVITEDFTLSKGLTNAASTFQI